MTDLKLTALSEDSSPTGDDMLYSVNDPTGFPASKKVKISSLLKLGLSISSASVTTSNVTGVEGTLHNLDVSGMTANRDFNLPTPAAAGRRVGVRLSVGDASYALLLKINGAEWSRIFITGEIVIFYSTGTGAGDWAIEQDGRIPCVAMIKNTGAQAIANATVSAVTLDEQDFDNASVTDEANNRLLIRRTSKYIIGGVIRLDNISAASTRFLVSVAEGGGGLISVNEIYAASGSYPAVTPSAIVSLSAGNTVVMTAYQNTGASQNTIAADYPRLSMCEILT